MECFGCLTCSECAVLRADLCSLVHHLFQYLWDIGCLFEELFICVGNMDKSGELGALVSFGHFDRILLHTVWINFHDLYY